MATTTPDTRLSSYRVRTTTRSWLTISGVAEALATQRTPLHIPTSVTSLPSQAPAVLIEPPGPVVSRTQVPRAAVYPFPDVYNPNTGGRASRTESNDDLGCFPLPTSTESLPRYIPIFTQRYHNSSYPDQSTLFGSGESTAVRLIPLDNLQLLANCHRPPYWHIQASSVTR